jgi:DNA-binding transcriptional LysR family regulator
MNNGLYEHLKVFVAIAQSRSLTGAAIASGIGQATISRQLAALEKHLGCRLFQRSTRAISLTEQGETYLQHALRLLELHEQAEAAVRHGDTQLRGRLRVACSIGFGRKLLIPALAQWQSRHPQLHMELLLSDQLSPLVEDRVDVAFRIAALQDSNLVARAIGLSERIVVAAPDYLRRHGPVRDPADLHNHQCILFAGAERPRVWSFTGPRGKTSLHVPTRLTLSTVDALQDAVLAGLGVAIMPSWFWGRERLDGQVVQLLPEYTLPAQTIHAVTASRQNRNGKVRQFIDYIAQRLRATEASGQRPD